LFWKVVNNKAAFVFERLNSKWDLRRLCKTVGATALPRLVWNFQMRSRQESIVEYVYLLTFVLFSRLPLL